jgi:DNA-binding NarL/FixJ family response regulator
VIFLTVHDDPDYVEAAFSAGALGYVLKTRLAVDLLPAVRDALQGYTFVSPPTGEEFRRPSLAAIPRNTHSSNEVQPSRALLILTVVDTFF